MAESSNLRHAEVCEDHGVTQTPKPAERIMDEATENVGVDPAPLPLVNTASHPSSSVDEWKKYWTQDRPMERKKEQPFVIAASTRLPDGKILPLRLLVDSGADISVMKPGVIPPEYTQPLSITRSAHGFGGSSTDATHMVHFPVIICGSTITSHKKVTACLPVSMFIMEVGGEHIDGILSRVWLGEQNTLLDCGNGEVIFRVRQKASERKMITEGPRDQEWVVRAIDSKKELPKPKKNKETPDCKFD